MTTSFPPVLALVPTVSTDRQFREAVDSIRAQDYPNVQIGVVLDGPVGDDEGFLDAPDLNVVSIPTRSGVAAALNRGLEFFDHEYVARLDADDTAAPHRISTQMRVLLSGQAAMVGSRACLIDESGRPLGEMGTAMSTTDTRKALTTSNPYIHSSILYRRRDVLSVGGYDTGCRRMQDYELWLRMALAGIDGCIIPEVLVQYRIHDGQSSLNAHNVMHSLRAITRHRRRLRAQLGTNLAWGAAQDAAWGAWQFARYRGFVQPRYLSGVNR